MNFFIPYLPDIYHLIKLHLTEQANEEELIPVYELLAKPTREDTRPDALAHYNEIEEAILALPITRNEQVAGYLRVASRIVNNYQTFHLYTDLPHRTAITIGLSETDPYIGLHEQVAHAPPEFVIHYSKLDNQYNVTTGHIDTRFQKEIDEFKSLVSTLQQDRHIRLLPIDKQFMVIYRLIIDGVYPLQGSPLTVKDIVKDTANMVTSFVKQFIRGK